MIQRGTDLAVFVAAGEGSRIQSDVPGLPKGLIRIGSETLIHRSIRLCRASGIRKFVFVVGYLEEDFRRALHGEPDITFVSNPAFKTSGSMYSLSFAEAYVDRDFILLESDIIFESRALQRINQPRSTPAVLASGITGAGDEVWVYGEDGVVERISKQAVASSVAGEYVGICYLTSDHFGRMCARANQLYQEGNLLIEYDSDILDPMSRERPLEYEKIEDLLWGEIDDSSQLTRVREVVDPAIRATEINS